MTHLPAPVDAFLHTNLELILAGLVLLTLLLFLLFLTTSVRLGRLNRLYRRLTKGTSGGNLEEILNEYMQTVTRVDEQVKRMVTKTDAIVIDQARCVQRVGLVRFDAFENVGGAQSFAVALLDGKRTGVVVSSVYSRTDARVYAKSLHEGQPSHPLTNEEAQAVALAEKGL